MRRPGSVLIVVLGLLAILAIVGVTFITMTSIDRNTAANFALQTQFMLAADGAIDYVCHHMVQDLWEYNETSVPKEYKEYLLTNRYTPTAGKEAWAYITNEPYDWSPIKTTSDPRLAPPCDIWLATTVDPDTLRSDMSVPDEFRASYEVPYPSATRNTYSCHYGIPEWLDKTPDDERPNNLGLPDSSGNIPVYGPGQKGTGVWIPDLSFPYETGLIRVSVTVQDHAALVNLNVHGNDTAAQNVYLKDATRHGYFVSDVDPSATKVAFTKITELIEGDGLRPGRWRIDRAPGNQCMLEPFIENPTKYGDQPYTLEEEVELRRPAGTAYTSRLEAFGGGLWQADDPLNPNATKAKKRLSVTTVGWVSEVRGDKRYRADDTATATHARAPGITTTGAWSCRKIDVNLDANINPGTGSDNPVQRIYDALADARCFNPKDASAAKKWAQFAANIYGFASNRPTSAAPGIKAFSVSGLTEPVVSASRQPVFSEVVARFQPGSGTTPDKWIIDVELLDPWRGDVAGDAGYASLAAAGISISPAPVASLPQKMPTRAMKVTIEKQGAQLTGEITMSCVGKVIDRIGTTEVGLLAQGKQLYRPIYVEDEKRGDADPCDPPIAVVYIGDWVEGKNGGSIGDWVPEKPKTLIPIRFPRSADPGAIPTPGGLPPRALPKGGQPPASLATFSFKAIPRIGDLNQILFPSDTDFWPWVVTVAKASASAGNEAADATLKFNWNDTAPVTASDYSRMNAANALSTGGPWANKADDDGDNYADDMNPPAGTLGPDTAMTSGTTVQGRFGGPELRVAGKVNLNTATIGTLEAIEKGVGISGLKEAVLKYRTASNNKPIVTPAVVVKENLTVTMPHGEEPVGYLEKQQLAWSRISNIVTVRSDTFSIYGTVQYIDAQAMAKAGTKEERARAVRRSRRFWALVDRSPSLAFYPGVTEFIRPRILNFQWLD